MRKGAWKWGLALGLSGAVHAGAAVFFLPQEPQVQVAGGQGAQIALAGTAFADMTAAGAPSEAIAPVAETATPVPPVETKVTAQTVEPVEAVTAVPVEQTPAPSDTTEPIEEITEAETAEPEEVEAAEPEEAEPARPKNEAVEPEVTEHTPAKTETAEIEPETPQETAVAMVPIPRPTPRPHYEPPEPKPQTARTQPARQAAPQPPAPRRTERSAGSGGRDNQDARRGTTSGSRDANAATSRSTAERASAAGDAAVSNYPGKIVSKLRRSLRYPREARRERLRGEVRVSFTVAQNGAVSGIRVVRSSGSPVLDRAAVETVQRAAPFPSIPAGAGRSSWPFTVPLAFTR